MSIVYVIGVPINVDYYSFCYIAPPKGCSRQPEMCPVSCVCVCGAYVGECENDANDRSPFLAKAWSDCHQMRRHDGVIILDRENLVILVRGTN